MIDAPLRALALVKFLLRLRRLFLGDGCIGGKAKQLPRNLVWRDTRVIVHIADFKRIADALHFSARPIPPVRLAPIRPERRLMRRIKAPMQVLCIRSHRHRRRKSGKKHSRFHPCSFHSMVKLIADSRPVPLTVNAAHTLMHLAANATTLSSRSFIFSPPLDIGYWILDICTFSHFPLPLRRASPFAKATEDKTEDRLIRANGFMGCSFRLFRLDLCTTLIFAQVTYRHSRRLERICRSVRG